MIPSRAYWTQACGTGAFLEAVEREYPRSVLVGIDASKDMLAVARKRLAPGAELMQGRAERLPFDAENFDVVVSSSVLHYIGDPSKVFAELRRILRGGGRLISTDGCEDYLACRICDMFLRLFSRAYHRSYSMREYRALIASAGFADIELRRYRAGWFWGLMTATAKRAWDFCD